MKKFVLLLLCGAMAFSLSLDSAVARPPYKKQFDEMYVKKDGETDAEKALFEAVEKQKCLVCHQAKEDGKNDVKKRNRYGEQLAKLLNKDDVKDVEKIKASIEKVAEMKVNPDDEKSPTFGDLIKEGKLPGEEEK